MMILMLLGLHHCLSSWCPARSRRDEPDDTARVWDVSSGKTLFAQATGGDGAYAAAFGPDGSRLVTDECESNSNGNNCGAIVWDVDTGKNLLTLQKSAYMLLAVQYSSDGKLIATARDAGTAQVWDANSGQLLHALTGHFGNISSIVFSPDGTQLATASWDGTAIIWDTATGRQLLVLRGHSNVVLDVAFSPDGKSVATASDDGSARIWDVSPEGSLEWITFTGHTGWVEDVRYSPDGTRIASIDLGDGAQVWDAATGHVLLRVPMGAGYNRGIAFSPDGKRLAVADDTKDAEVWDSVSGKRLLTLYTTGNPGSAIDYSPDGKYIIEMIVGNLSPVTVWDATTGKLIPGTSFTAGGMAFSRDGKHLALANWDKTNIYDTQTWKVVLSLSGPGPGYNGGGKNIAYSSDSTRIVTAKVDGTLRAWDASTGKELYTLYGHTSEVNGAAFSPDGKYLAATVAGGITKLWDLSQVGQPDAQPISLYGHTRDVVPLAFSPDGKRLATGGDDGTVRVYALDLDDLIGIAKSRVTRTLTADECQEYLHEQTCPPGP